ncbi:MAG: hypothetical protein M1814_000544 [Vezdaea aestivalis]|nr:MAG: hypothetical protein M1814_000544 [Vezdaea aestivalis]
MPPKRKAHTEGDFRSKRRCTRPSSSPSLGYRKRKRIEDFESTKSGEQAGRPAELTRRNLSLLERLTNGMAPDGTDSFSTTATSRDTESVSKNNVNPRHTLYPYELECRGAVFADDGEPDDASTVREILGRSRGDNPLDAESGAASAQDFRAQVATTSSEASAMSKIISKLIPDQGEISRSPDRYSIENVPWSAPNYPFPLSPDSTHGIAVPKADLTLGWTIKAFESSQIAAISSQYSKPKIKNKISFLPYFTVEVKGESGSLQVARLQNLHNALAIASNFIQLKRLAGTEDEFHGKVFAMTIELTAEVMQLSWYWTKKDGEDFKMYGTYEKIWAMMDKDPLNYLTAKNYFLNAIEYLEKHTKSWIARDLAKLKSKIQPNIPITPQSTVSRQPSESGSGSPVTRQLYRRYRGDYYWLHMGRARIMERGASALLSLWPDVSSFVPSSTHV